MLHPLVVSMVNKGWEMRMWKMELISGAFALAFWLDLSSTCQGPSHEGPSHDGPKHILA